MGGGGGFITGSSIREVRRRVPFLLWSILVGKPSPKKGKGALLEDPDKHPQSQLGGLSGAKWEFKLWRGLKHHYVERAEHLRGCAVGGVMFKEGCECSCYFSPYLRTWFLMLLTHHPTRNNYLSDA